MTKNRTLLDLLLCSTSFVATVIVCVALQPSDVFSHDGLSFYGNFANTIMPYGIGLLAAAYFLLRACYTLKDTLAAHSFRIALEAIAIGLLGIVATPSFTHILAVQDLHVIFGFVIFITEAMVSLHYIGRDGRYKIDWILLGLQMIAIVLVALSFRTIAILDLMLPAQVLATVSFGTLLVRAVARHEEEVPTSYNHSITG
jgi:hypothetical protein